MSYKRGLAVVFGCTIAALVSFAATYPRFYPSPSPVSAPVAVLNAAQPGLFEIVNVSALPTPASASDALGVKLYALFAATDTPGDPEIIGVWSFTLVNVIVPAAGVVAGFVPSDADSK